MPSTAASPDKHSGHRQAGSPAMRPFHITWHGKSYAVTNVKDYHTVKQNGELMHIFSANDGTGTFELTFNSEEMSWFLGD